MTTPIYNQIGLTIDTLTATGTDASTGAPIERSGGTTVVVVSSTETDHAVVLPSDAEIGDIVEVHQLDAGSDSNVTICAPSGTNFGATSLLLTRTIGGSTGIFRKLSATLWGSSS